jgi:hypothetical protein
MPDVVGIHLTCLESTDQQLTPFGGSNSFFEAKVWARVSNKHHYNPLGKGIGQARGEVYKKPHQWESRQLLRGPLCREKN